MIKNKESKIQNCLHCQRKFIRKMTHQKYCSVGCRMKDYEIKGIINNRNKEKTAEKNCLFCGEVFVYNLRNSQKYCSVDCREKDYKQKGIRSKKCQKQDSFKFEIERRVKMILEKAKSTKPKESLGVIISEFTLDSFTEKIKNEVRERDGQCCQICEVKNERLEVHHILKRKLGGSNELDNLITLCVKCHRAIETGDEEHAVKTCYKNAERVNGRELGDKLTNPEKINILTSCLEDVFGELNSEKGFEEKELLLKINKALSIIQ